MYIIFSKFKRFCMKINPRLAFFGGGALSGLEFGSFGKGSFLGLVGVAVY